MEWTSVHINSWLNWCARKFSIQPKPDPEKFPTSGSKLCELTRNDFEIATNCRRIGTILAKHIAYLRHSVSGRASSPLNVECKEFDDENDNARGGADHDEDDGNSEDKGKLLRVY